MLSFLLKKEYRTPRTAGTATSEFDDWENIHCEVEKRNNFLLCASLLILDRNW